MFRLRDSLFAATVLAGALMPAAPAQAGGCCGPIVGAVDRASAAITAAISSATTSIVTAITMHGQDQSALLETQTQALAGVIAGQTTADTARARQELALDAKLDNTPPPGSCATATSGRRSRSADALMTERSRVVTSEMSGYVRNPAEQDGDFGGTVYALLDKIATMEETEPVDATLVFRTEPLPADQLERAKTFNRLVADPKPPTRPTQDAFGTGVLAHRARADRVGVALETMNQIAMQNVAFGEQYTEWAEEFGNVGVTPDSSWYQLMRDEAGRRFLTGWGSMDLKTEMEVLRDLNQQGGYALYLDWHRYELERRRTYMTAQILALLSDLAYKLETGGELKMASGG